MVISILVYLLVGLFIAAHFQTTDNHAYNFKRASTDIILFSLLWPVFIGVITYAVGDSFVEFLKEKKNNY